MNMIMPISSPPLSQSPADSARARPTLNDPQERELTMAMEAMSCPVRLQVFMTLCETGPQYVSQLCERMGMRQPTMSHHLGLLRICGLVRSRRDGKNVWYEPAPERVMYRRTSAPGDESGDRGGDDLEITLNRSHGIRITLSVRLSADAAVAAPSASRSLARAA